MFIRKLGPQLKGNCQGGFACPDLIEMAGGDFAVIGLDITAESLPHLPPGTGCGAGERIVRIPRHVLVAARSDIPERL